jgi:hypothetical protein
MNMSGRDRGGASGGGRGVEGRKNIDGEKPQLSTWRLRDEVLTLFQEV